MATATAHPDWRLISSEDVEGTTVYDMSGNQIGSVDHLMIDKVSGRVRLRRNELRWVPRPRPQPLSDTVGRTDL